MKLDEVETNSERLTRFRKNFRVSPRSSTNVNFNENNEVIVNGNCGMLTKSDRLPFNFKHITGNFNISNSSLTTLEGCPDSLSGNLTAYYNHITSLIGGPRMIAGDYYISYNPLTSLEGLPEYIGGDLYLSYNENLPLLPLLNINSVNYIGFENRSADTSLKHIEEILKKYLGKGRLGMLACAAELTRAGYKSNAKLK